MCKRVCKAAYRDVSVNFLAFSLSGRPPDGISFSSSSFFFFCLFLLSLSFFFILNF